VLETALRLVDAQTVHVEFRIPSFLDTEYDVRW
jgi:hypothetical protein